MSYQRSVGGLSDIFSSIGKVGGTVAGAATEFFGQSAREQGRAEALQQTQQVLAQQQGGAIDWSKYLPYAAIGGGLLLILLAMKKKGQK